MRLQGLATPFNLETTIAGSFREVVRPGAFARSLKSRDQFLLYGHRMDGVLSSVANGTLVLQEEERGLAFSGTLAETVLAADTHELVKGGFVSGMSFGFIPVEDRWVDDGQKLPLRELLEVQIYEISVVAAPAYRGTSVMATRALTRQARRLLNGKLDSYRRRAMEVQIN